MTSKNGPIRTLFEESWLWVINLALRTRTPGGRGGRLNADKCGQGGRGVKNWQNFADVFYGWPLIVPGCTWTRLNPQVFHSITSYT